MHSAVETVRDIFFLVCNIPYGGVGERDASETAKKNKGSCSAKHVLLGRLLNEIGFDVKYMIGKSDLHEFGANMVRPIFVEKGTYDFHNFLKVNVKGAWITLDATFGVNEEPIAMRNNLHWNGVDDCHILFPVESEIVVHDAFSAKTKSLQTLTPKQRTARESFFSDFQQRLRPD